MLRSEQPDTMALLRLAVAGATGLPAEGADCQAIADTLREMIAPTLEVVLHEYGRVTAYIERGVCQGVARTKTNLASGRRGGRLDADD